MAKGNEILDKEIQSRYHKTHGENGLCFVLMEIFNAMAELRLKADYADILAYSRTALEGERMNDMIWKIETLN